MCRFSKIERNHGREQPASALPDLGDQQPPMKSERSASSGRAHGAHGSCLLCDYLARETSERKRIIDENDGFVALVPFWATWPSKPCCSPNATLALRHFGPEESELLADMLKRLTLRYDNLFETPSLYDGLSPTTERRLTHPHWHFHGHFYHRCCAQPPFAIHVGFECWGLLNVTSRRRPPCDCVAVANSLSDRAVTPNLSGITLNWSVSEGRSPEPPPVGK